MGVMSDLAILSGRAVLKVSGPDARTFLQGVVSQELSQLDDSNAAFSCLLTPQGKILFDFLIAARGGDLYFDVAADSADGLAKRLAIYRLRAKATIERLGDWAVGWSPTPEPSADFSYADPRLRDLGARTLGPAADFSGSRADGEYDARRISLGVPEFGRDFSADDVFLLDVNYDALNGVSYKKGCFVGQEVTSRMKRKGEVRRRTLTASFEGPALAAGAEIAAGESSIGRITSSVDGRALALVRVDRLAAATAAGAALACEGRPLQLAFPEYLERG